MHFGYSDEKNVQMLVALLKENNIKKIVISPGSTNFCFNVSVQYDDFFEIYSCVDERSAAYMACGMAAESGEPVVLSCTMATAARNYIPALTEAYYRKLPVLAITSTESLVKVGHGLEQYTDRTQPLKDIVISSHELRMPHSEIEVWDSNSKINQALIDLKRHGGGPVHLNLETACSTDFSVERLPEVRKVEYFTEQDSLPDIRDGRIGIFVGSHMRWNERLTQTIDCFCEQYDAVVLVDQTSNYKGKYGIPFTLINSQKNYRTDKLDIDLLIHIGSVSASSSGLARIKHVWRVSESDKIWDTFQKLTAVFEMPEQSFFDFYIAADRNKTECLFYQMWKEEYRSVYDKLIEQRENIPFSNLWIASKLHNCLPANCAIHFGIKNSLRCWNFFMTDLSVSGYSNTGGFGIDGCVSSLIGASFIHTDRLYLGVVGDLAFFYDMNVLGNRHIKNNVRLMVINNGLGVEFKQKSHPSQRCGMADDADGYIAAAGHYGNQSKNLLKNYATELGFEYQSASNKEEFERSYPRFIDNEAHEKPMFFEIFADSMDEVNALSLVSELKKNNQGMIRNKVKNVIGAENVKKILKVVKNREK